MWQNIEVK